VFVLDMGHPVRVLALAKDLIRLSGLVPDQDVPIRIIGRRPGEKLQEDLLNETETMGARRDGPFYIAPAEPVHLSRLLFQIKQLRRAAEAHCTDRVVRMLREIVPTYSPDAAHAQSRTSDRPVETELVRQAS
jgi:FlaA1/EpsC-like NDP-sugar epimerase